MRISVFRSGIRPRLLAALSFAVVVFALVSVLTKTHLPDPTAGEIRPGTEHSSTNVEPVRLRLDIESARPVEVWIVRLGEVEIKPVSSSELGWQGEVFVISGAPDADLLSVLAFAPTSARGSNALRIRAFPEDAAQAAVDDTHWCDGSDCAVELSLTEARP